MSRDQRLHLWGDSIFRGAVTDIVDNRAPCLVPLQSPAAVINLVLGRPYATFAGETLFPHSTLQAEQQIARAFTEGLMADGDVVAFLDVGPHAMDIAKHESDWLGLRAAASRDHAVKLIMCSGFDDGGRGIAFQLHEAPLDGRSPNDAVRAAALAEQDFRGSTQFLDLAAALKRLKARMAAEFGRSPFFSDGVHLNAWGQIFLALLMLRAAHGRTQGLGGLPAAVVESRKHLGVWSEERAVQMLRLIAQEAGFNASDLERRRLAARLKRTAARMVGAFRGWRASDGRAAQAEALLLIREGERRLEAGEAEAALDLFRRAGALDPQSLTALQGRVKAAADAGRPEEVVEAGRAALALAPAEGKYYVWIAHALLQLKAGPEEVAWLDSLAEVHASSRAAAAMAELNARLGDPARADLWTRRAAGRP